MFMEDLRNQVVPYRLDRSPTMSVQVTPGRYRIRRLVAEAFKLGAWDPDDAAEEFVRDCATSLIENEVVPYEIERLRRPRAKRISIVTLRPIQPWSVEPARGGLVQQVPETDREIGGYLGDRLPAAIFLADENLLYFRLPPDLREELHAVLQDLQAVPDPSLPTWLPEELAKSTADRIAIDVEELKARRAAAVAGATRRPGWDARWSLQGVVNEYYILIRQIRWQRFLCRLRTAVLETLNSALPVVLEPLKITAAVSSVGLPSLQELQRLEDGLANGTVPLGEGYSSISLWRFGKDVHRNAAVVSKDPDDIGPEAT